MIRIHHQTDISIIAILFLNYLYSTCFIFAYCETASASRLGKSDSLADSEMEGSETGLLLLENKVSKSIRFEFFMHPNANLDSQSCCI